MNEFEKRLQKQQFRSIPPEWRKEILNTQSDTATEKRSFLAVLREQITALLWPHPKAWAGMAAAWVLILVANYSTSRDTMQLASKAPAPSPEYLRGLREQERFLAQLLEKPQIPVAEPPKTFVPRPRSENKFRFVNA